MTLLIGVRTVNRRLKGRKLPLREGGKEREEAFVYGRSPFFAKFPGFRNPDRTRDSLADIALALPQDPPPPPGFITRAQYRYLGEVLGRRSRYLSAAELARFLGCSDALVHNKAEAGLIPAERIPHFRFPMVLRSDAPGIKENLEAIKSRPGRPRALKKPKPSGKGPADYYLYKGRRFESLAGLAAWAGVSDWRRIRDRIGVVYRERESS